MEQVEIIRLCLDTFCSTSGEKVNREKSKIFFPKNIIHNRLNEINGVLGFSRTSNLGKYLETPLHHKRGSKASFNIILEKISNHLSSSKANTLSLTRRITLTKSIIIIIPQYYMQTKKLPITIYDQVEKLSVALYREQPLCQPKQSKGLGIQNMKESNEAYMMKLV